MYKHLFSAWPGHRQAFILSAMLWLAAACGPSQPEDSEAPAYRGSWVATANLGDYPELLYLYLDSLAMIKLYYKDIDLHPVDSFRVKGRTLSFQIDDPRFKAKFQGELKDSTELLGHFTWGNQSVSCNFVKLAPSDMELMGSASGFYQLDENHVVEVQPSMLDFNLMPLMVLDFHSGKKRAAYPGPTGWFTAGPQLYTPHPTDFKLSFNLEDMPAKLFLQEGEQVTTGLRMADLERVEDITVENGLVSLSGTLTFPATEAPYPLVVFTHPAGPSFRGNIDEDFIKLLPYYGVATLVYDKRGYGESTGEEGTAAFEDLASDLEAVLAATAKHPAIDAKRIGLLGSDQAGLVMPMAAQKSPHVSFMVSIAGSIISMEEQEIAACSLRMQADGFSTHEIANALAYQQTFFAYLRGEADSLTIQQAYATAEDQVWAEYVTPFSSKPRVQWWRRNRSISPAPALATLNIPVLAIFGERDLLVPVRENTERLRPLLKHPESSIQVFEGANHMMLLGEKRGDFQLTEIQGYPPGLFYLINRWIADRTGLTLETLAKTP